MQRFGIEGVFVETNFLGKKNKLKKLEIAPFFSFLHLKT